MGREPADPTHGCYMAERDIVAAPYNDLGLADSESMYKQVGAGDRWEIGKRG